MRVLIDITHPVDVHLFKHLIKQLEADGHRVMVTSRDKDVTIDLLNALGMPHHCLSTARSGTLSMAGELIARWVRLWRLARRFRPDVMVAEVGVSIGLIGAILGVPRVVFDQADIAQLQRAVGLPFATVLCTGEGYSKRHLARQVHFRGFLVQSYLDPRRFQPDPQPLRDAGVDPDEPYIVMRLVGWSATHDTGRKGLSEKSLLQAIERLERFGRVLVSSEKALPESLQAYANPVPPLHLHDLLGLAQLCIAEGGTVAMEAGVQGTPAICCNTYDFGYLKALEGYGVIRRAADLQDALSAAESMLQTDALRQWQQLRTKLFASTEDVVAFMQRIVEQVARGERT